MQNFKSIIYYTSIVLFMILFYKQGLGLNLLIMSLFLITTSFIYYRNSINKKTILFCSILLSVSFSAFYYGDWVSILSCYIGFFTLPFFFLDYQKTSLLAIPVSIKSLWTNTSNICKQLTQLNNHHSENGMYKFFALVLVPIFVLIIFLSVYCIANDDFYRLISNILEYISIDFFIVLALAIYLMYCFWNYINDTYFEKKYSRYLKDTFDLNMSQNEMTSTNKIWYKSGIILFSVLNIILLMFIFTEFIQIEDIKQKLLYPQSSNEMILNIFECVLTSCTSIISSILMAISLIFIYFKKELNFNKSSQTLKYLALTWIVLNTIILITAGIKVFYSIDYSGYTVKRLGVYCFLILCSIGLVFTYIKIEEKRPNFYVIKRMAWIFATTLGLILPINWGSIITKINFDLLENQNKPIEIWRLWEQMEYNHTELLPYLESKKVNDDDKNTILSVLHKFDFNKQTWQELNLYNYQTQPKLIKYYNGDKKFD